MSSVVVSEMNDSVNATVAQVGNTLAGVGNAWAVAVCRLVSVGGTSVGLEEED